MLPSKSLFRSIIIAVAAVILLPLTVFSQSDKEQKIDSILSTLAGKDYEERRNSYLDINSFIMRNGGKDAEQLFEYAITKDSTDLGRMVMYEDLGKVLSRQGNTDQALKIKQIGLELGKKLEDQRYIIQYNLDLANLYTYQNTPDKALYHLNIAEPLTDEPGYEAFKVFLNYNKGMLASIQGDMEAEHDAYIAMWEAIKDQPNSPRKRFSLYILVNFLSQTDYHEELAKYTEILSELYEDANPNMPEGHMPIKEIFEKQNDPSNIPALKKSIRISDSLNSLNTLTFSSIVLAQIYSKMGTPDTSNTLLQNALQKLDTVNKPQLKLYLFSALSKINAESEKYENAYTYKVEETVLRDSINSERMQRNIAELEVKFDTEKKERKIAEQDLQLEKEARQKNQILLGLFALGIILIVSLLFFRKRLDDQRTIAAQKQEIQQQEITDLKQKNKLLALNSMIEGQEAERLRIAKDLHDSLGGLLSTVKAHFTSIQKQIEELEKLNITEKTNELIDEACIEVRRISHNMMPHALSISGLTGAIEDIASNLKDEGYEVTVEISNMPENIEKTREVMIYRLVQEITSNIRKHAEAKSVLIQMLGFQDEINVIIEDDGKGFDLDKAKVKGGLGLKSINSRVDFLDGSIHWDTNPGQGTSLTINIPRK